MANFYATYSTGSSGGGGGGSVTQGTVPWVVSGQGTAGTAATGVVTVQGIASGTAVPISGTVAVSGTVAATQSGTWNITNVSGTVSLPTGAATETTLAAQSAKLPATLGQKTMAASMAVAIASDQSAVPVSGTVAISGTVATTQSGTWTVQPGNTQNTTPWLSTISAGGNAAAVSASNALKVDGSAVTQPVSVASLPAVTTSTAVFQAEGAVAFGSITNSFVTLFTPSAGTKMIQMRNNMNTSVAVSMDAGTTTNYVLDAGDAISLDLLANSLNMGATAIQVKYVSAPASGSFRINACH